jgi:hypothetical protein
MSPGLPTMLIQYCRSFEHLKRYARARGREHWPAWVEFNRRTKDSRGDVGIWRETYLVRAGEHEMVYSGMPLIGLAKASRRAEVTAETESARLRLGGGGKAERNPRGTRRAQYARPSWRGARVLPAP